MAGGKFNGEHISGELPPAFRGGFDELITRGDFEQWANEAAEEFAGDWADKRLRVAQSRQKKVRPLTPGYVAQKKRRGYTTKPIVRTGETFRTYFKTVSNLVVKAFVRGFYVKTTIPPEKAKTVVFLFNAIRRKKHFIQLTAGKITKKLTDRMGGN